MTVPPSLERLPDWQDRLASFVAACRQAAFAWGAHDCVTFAAGDVRAVTGTDPLAVQGPGRGWADRRSAVRAVRAVGPSLHAAVCAVLGRPVAPAFATIGDIGYCRLPDAQAVPRGALIVCNGDTWLAVGRQGLEVLPFGVALGAWKVG